MDLIILENLTAGFVIFATFVLGLIIYSNRSRSATHIIFFLFCLDTIFWTVANYLSLRYLTLFWIRLVLFFAAPQALLFFLFIHTFPDDKIRLSKKIASLLVFSTILVMLLALSPYVFTRLEPRDGQVIPVPGPSILLFILLTIGSYLAGVFYAFKKSFSDGGNIQKKQWQYISGGFLITFLLVIIFNFIAVVVFKESGFVRFGSSFFLPFILGSTVAIVRYRLMNVKVIATEFLTLTICLALFVQVFISQDPLRLILNSAIFLSVAVASVFLVRSILKEIELKDKLQITYGELKKLDEAKSEFISIASHQLRTPLSAIKGYISMILEGTYGHLEDKAKKPLQNVYQANERLVKLVNDLLDVSRIEAGRVELEKENVSLEDLINSAIDIFKIRAKEKGLYLKLEKNKDLQPVMFLDKQKIGQVILNLIDNAIRYTEKGGVTVRFSQRKESSSVLIEIKDTGIGIEKEELPELFASFSRGQAGSKYWTEGMGFGLYVAKKFVEMHRGKVWVESEGQEKGSTFYIELPL